jgi:alkyl sulfatase BDS1-like metallo-beta-lactamase superfamily hydrolase
MLIRFAGKFRAVAIAASVVFVLALPLAASAEVSKASLTTERLNKEVLSQLPFTSNEDFEFAQRGFIGTNTERFIKNAKGEVIWDFESYDFLGKDDSPAPASVNPSLWRQAKLLVKHGLFKVTDRIYQVRGFDVSNMSVIVSDTGYILIDPLSSVEPAQAALQLVKKYLGDKPVVAVIYTHTHTDHFAGVAGVTTEADIKARRTLIIAPEHFLKHVASENVIAGNAMARRSTYYMALMIPKGVMGGVTSGLGPAASMGTGSLFEPTHSIKKTGDKMTIDGVEMVFQMTPGTEAPAEMNFYFPQFKALMMAENANGAMHNILTLRGAEVRDARAWAEYLQEAVRLYGDKSEVMFASHFWPRFGRENLNSFIKKQADMYKYMHDQTMRLMNHGLTGTEIAEELRFPDVLDKEWYNRGYYGTLSHNSKAIYQRYMGWYDGNPASLHTLPPLEAGRKYVEFMGGEDAVLSKVKKSFDNGDYRWTAQVLNHVVFANPKNFQARELLAQTYEQLGYQAEAGTWRGIYLMGAMELRKGAPKGVSFAPFGPAVASALTPELLFDYMSVRLNGPKAATSPATFQVDITDTKASYLLSIRNGALWAEKGQTAPNTDAQLSLSRQTLVDLLVNDAKVNQKLAAGELKIDGNKEKFTALLGMLDKFNFFFNIVEP